MSENWVVGTCWACGSANIRQNPDRRPVGQSKYLCLGCGNHMGSVRPSTVKETPE